MHKGLELLREERSHREICKGYLEKGKKNIIFLDIDGVLKSYGSQKRFAHDIDATIDYLCERYDPEVVKHGDVHDVAAAFYDWDEIAVGRIAYLCRHTGSYIVMSTSWRQWNDTERFRLFLSFYGLEDYLLDTCENVPEDEMRESRNHTDYFGKDNIICIPLKIKTSKKRSTKPFIAHSAWSIFMQKSRLAYRLPAELKKIPYRSITIYSK